MQRGRVVVCIESIARANNILETKKASVTTETFVGVDGVEPPTLCL